MNATDFVKISSDNVDVAGFRHNARLTNDNKEARHRKLDAIIVAKTDHQTVLVPIKDL